jgi:hypothetical protein
MVPIDNAAFKDSHRQIDSAPKFEPSLLPVHAANVTLVPKSNLSKGVIRLGCPDNVLALRGKSH